MDPVPIAICNLHAGATKAAPLFAHGFDITPRRERRTGASQNHTPNIHVLVDTRCRIREIIRILRFAQWVPAIRPVDGQCHDMTVFFENQRI